MGQVNNLPEDSDPIAENQEECGKMVGFRHMLLVDYWARILRSIWHMLQRLLKFIDKLYK